MALKNDILHNRIDDTAHCFRTGQTKKGLDNIPHLIDAISAQMNYLSQAANTQDQIIKINEYLGILSDALANQDYIFVADILGYGLKPLLTAL